VLTAVVEARAKATLVRIDASQLDDPAKLKQFQDAQNQLTGALAVSENYPELKSSRRNWRRWSRSPLTGSLRGS
jgi:LemA protein